MTVANLIKKLMEVEDKNIQVKIEIKNNEVDCYDAIVIMDDDGKHVRIECD
jgi:hypothetical protein